MDAALNSTYPSRSAAQSNKLAVKQLYFNCDDESTPLFKNKVQEAPNVRHRLYLDPTK